MDDLSLICFLGAVFVLFFALFRLRGLSVSIPFIEGDESSHLSKEKFHESPKINKNIRMATDAFKEIEARDKCGFESLSREMDFISPDLKMAVWLASHESANPPELEGWNSNGYY